jgi:putative transposase
VTICVQNRRPVLVNFETLEALKLVGSKFQDWRILAAVIMPDHMHVIVTPTKDRDARVSNFSAALKRWMREELGAEWNWQRGCFDRLLRSDESLHAKWLYLLANPVRAGLVSDPDDWAYRMGFEKL